MISKTEPRMTPIEVARSVFPDQRVPDEFLEYLIWNETGYPSFWQSNNPASEMLRQLQHYKDQYDQGLVAEEYEP